MSAAPEHEPMPSYDEFAAEAKAITAKIPPEYTEDVEDVVVHRGLKRHPILGDIVTLGECEPSPLAAMTASGLVRSIVHLYYGSFVDLARSDPTFDVGAELEETIRHELQHHLEDKAGVRSLIDEDDLFEAHARFRADLDVPPGWYRQGEPLETGVWSVDLDLFVELRMRRAEFEALRGKTLRLTVLDQPVETEIPADAHPDEVFTLEGEGLLDEGDADREHGHGHVYESRKGESRKGESRKGEPPKGPTGESDGGGASDDKSEDGEDPPTGDMHIIPIVR